MDPLLLKPYSIHLLEMEGILVAPRLVGDNFHCEMLILSALGSGSLTFRLPGNWQAIDRTSPNRLPYLPDAARLGRVTLPGIPLRRSPSNSNGDQNLISRLPADTKVVWERDMVQTVVDGTGFPRYIKTPDGYIYGGMIQPVDNQPNSRIDEIPSGKDRF